MIAINTITLHTTALIHLFNSVFSLSKEDITLLNNRLSIERISKNHSYCTQNTICKKMGFVLDGIFKVEKTNELGNKYIPYFITKDHFAVDILSYTTNTISDENIIALTECTVATITKKDYDFLEKNISNFSKIIGFLKEKALLEKLKLKNEMLIDDAEVKYQKLLQRQPTIVQNVPQSQIALHLGITQYTLSRIKSKK